MTTGPLTRAEQLRASPPVFASPSLDRFTRVHPAAPVVLYGPAVFAFVVMALRTTHWPIAAALFLTGYLAWTLTEYWAHRTAFHWVPPGRWGRRVHWMMHGIHHDHPNDARRLVVPPLASLPVAVGVFLLFRCLPGKGVDFAVTAGFLTGYLAYEMVHFHVHHHRPSTKLGRSLRRGHLLHHFQDDERGFGVSCPYWDYVFGTAPKPPSPRGKAVEAPCAALAALRRELSRARRSRLVPGVADRPALDPRAPRHGQERGSA
ncbi:sterol desaturase family protein [Streptomyces sp. NPDC006627]|uniref:sterol desaturase family protein n=1 Tax=Streptomyces sp. NPDC006627 TaxID=3154679 RepID=UPI0033A5C538